MLERIVIYQFPFKEEETEKFLLDTCDIQGHEINSFLFELPEKETEEGLLDYPAEIRDAIKESLINQPEDFGGFILFYEK